MRTLACAPTRGAWAYRWAWLACVLLLGASCTRARALDTPVVPQATPTPTPTPTAPVVPAAPPPPALAPPLPVQPLPAVRPQATLPPGKPGVVTPADPLPPIANPVASGPAGQPAATPTMGGTLLAVVNARPELSTLGLLVRLGELDGALAAASPHTLFAPTNSAFNKLPTADLVNLQRLENRETLKRILRFHLTQGSITRAMLVPQAASAPLQVQTLEGVMLTVTRSPEGSPALPDAGIAQADVAASNGVLHLLDTVMMPPDLNPTATDVMSLVERDPELSTLKLLLDESGVAATLRTTAVHTLLAPTNAAFNRLNAGSLALLRQPANAGSLTSLLRFHVVAERQRSSVLLTRDSLGSLLGPAIPVTRQPGTVNLQNHPIRLFDQFARNGMMHVVDGVLLPEGYTLPVP